MVLQRVHSKSCIQIGTSSSNSINLETIFDDDVGRRFFKKFLESVYNMEPMLFIEEVEEYTKLKSSQNRYYKAHEIIQNFMNPKSKTELNISQATRVELKREYESKCSKDHCPRELFDNCVIQIMLEIKEDIWPRFITSNELSLYRTFLLTQSSNDNDDSQSAAQQQQQQQQQQQMGCEFSKTEYSISDLEYNTVKQWAYEQSIDDIPWKVIQKKDDDQYISYITKKGVKLGGKSGKPIRMWKVSGTVPFPFQLVVDQLIANKTTDTIPFLLQQSQQSQQQQQEESFDQYVTVLDKLTTTTTITCEEVKFPLSFISNRYFTFSTSVKYETVGSEINRVILLSKTVEYPTSSKFLKSTNAVKAECICATIVEQFNDTETKYVHVVWMDVKGSIPKYIWRKMITINCTKYHRQLIRNCNSNSSTTAHY